MIWPPNDNAVVEQQSSKRQHVAIKHSSDKHSSDKDPVEPFSSFPCRTSSSGFNYTILKRKWKPAGATARSQHHLLGDYGENAPSRRKLARSSTQGIRYDEDSDPDVPSHEPAKNQKTSSLQPTNSTTERFEKNSRLTPSLPTSVPPRKKTRTRISCPQKTSPERSHQRPRSSGLMSVRNRSQAPTPQSSRPSVAVENSNSDDDMLILDYAPPAFSRTPQIKDEKTAIKTEPLSAEVCLSR